MSNHKGYDTIKTIEQNSMYVHIVRYKCSNVEERRLVESKKLIELGNTMEEISLVVGFQEYSAFYRAFKAEYGISPMQYRKMIQ